METAEALDSVAVTAESQTATKHSFYPELGKFLIAGAACVVIQLAVMELLTQRFGASVYLASFAGLAVSVPCNFILSYFWTFGQRSHRQARASGAARESGRYLVAAAMTVATYWVSLALAKAGVAALSVAARVTGLVPHVSDARLITQTTVAEVCALTATAFVAWQLQSRFVFWPRKRRPTEEIQHASLEDLRRIAEEGIAWFLPAYDEAGNLRAVTDDLMATLRQLAVRFRVIVVNDGSEDGTATVAATLADTYPEVELVSHEANLGYGPALRTGLEACYGTGYGLIGFYDADDQFRPHSLLTLLTKMQQTRTDMVIGARIKRADRGLRNLNGKVWGAISQLVLHYCAEDTDAGCKLFRRRVVSEVLPYLDAQRGAGISPQILSYSQNLGFKSAETGVVHYPRTAGHNTGNDLRVIVRSFIDLFRTRFKLHRELVKRGLRRRRINPSTKAVLAAASVISVAAYLHFYSGGRTIAYGDAKSHLLIARRVLFADTPGVGQLGGVWLPLPHILMLPLVWDNWAYYNGFAGSIVMMLAYVVCAVLIYKFVWHLTYRRWAAICGTAVFALNPNVLYMQATPMTELLMFVTMMGATYGLLRWIQTGDSDQFHHLYLLGAGLSAMLCALTRYEGWTIAVALTGVVLYCSLTRLRLMARLVVTGFITASVVLAGWAFVHFGPLALALVPAAVFGYVYLKRLYRRNDWDLTEGQLIAFGILGAGGPLAWMIWNWVIFGDPLAFQSGPYAKPSLWVDSGEKAVHNIVIAFRTYEIATVDNLTPVVAILAVIGLAVYLWRTRLSAESWPALALLVMFPLFVVTLYKGERPLHVYQYYYNFYNVRFGLVMILPACVLIGFLAAELARILENKLHSRWWAAAVRSTPAIAVILTAALTAAGSLQSGSLVTLMEPLAAQATPTASHARAAARWIRTHYTGGRLLMESYGNEEVAFASHVPAEDQVYEGSYRLWLPTLANPSGHGIAWIVMRTEKNDRDQVYKDLFGSSLIDGYRRVWSNTDYIIYASKQTIAQMLAKRAMTAGASHQQTRLLRSGAPALTGAPAELANLPVSK
jgi:glycosyltransferase involved in cell wall biosynthesis/putative flippase GtrA